MADLEPAGMSVRSATPRGKKAAKRKHLSDIERPSQRESVRRARRMHAEPGIPDGDEEEEEEKEEEGEDEEEDGKKRKKGSDKKVEGKATTVPPKKRGRPRKAAPEGGIGDVAKSPPETMV